MFFEDIMVVLFFFLISIIFKQCLNNIYVYV